MPPPPLGKWLQFSFGLFLLLSVPTKLGFLGERPEIRVVLERIGREAALLDRPLLGRLMRRRKKSRAPPAVTVCMVTD